MLFLRIGIQFALPALYPIRRSRCLVVSCFSGRIVSARYSGHPLAVQFTGGVSATRLRCRSALIVTLPIDGIEARRASEESTHFPRLARWGFRCRRVPLATPAVGKVTIKALPLDRCRLCFQVDSGILSVPGFGSPAVGSLRTSSARPGLAPPRKGGMDEGFTSRNDELARSTAGPLRRG